LGRRNRCAAFFSKAPPGRQRLRAVEFPVGDLDVVRVLEVHDEIDDINGIQPHNPRRASPCG
jgi:hypothetical protein